MKHTSTCTNSAIVNRPENYKWGTNFARHCTILFLSLKATIPYPFFDKMIRLRPVFGYLCIRVSFVIPS